MRWNIKSPTLTFLTFMPPPPGKTKLLLTFACLLVCALASYGKGISYEKTDLTQPTLDKLHSQDSTVPLSGYTLTESAVESEDTVVKYLVDPDTKVVTPVYYNVSVKNRSFGDNTQSGIKYYEWENQEQGKGLKEVSTPTDASKAYTLYYNPGSASAKYKNSENLPDLNITENYINITTDSGTDNTGGAVQNSRNAVMNDIRGDFIGNTLDANASGKGGAVFNDERAVIHGIYGNFAQNTVKVRNTATTEANGGAIWNNGLITEIMGNFIGNYIIGDVNFINVRNAYGGAVYNSDRGTINTIKGDFIGNHATGLTIGYGGAIYNKGIINSIEGNFINNYARGEDRSGNGQFVKPGGGAIFTVKEIGSIKGDFIGNYVVADPDQNSLAQGGAILSLGNNMHIGDIKGDFIGNYIVGYNNSVSGGAIHNEGAVIDSIEGDFIGNHAQGSQSSNTSGGAISNLNGKIHSIKGDFIGNYVTAEAREALAAGIMNSGIINNVTGDFVDNYVFSTRSWTNGGAFKSSGNSSVITFTDSSFINNRAESVKGYGSRGGAMNIEAGVVNIIAADKDVEFTGNKAILYTDAAKTTVWSERESGITMKQGTLNLNAGAHKIIFNDFIESQDGNQNSTININRTGDWNAAESPDTPQGNKISHLAPTTGTILINNNNSNFAGTLNLFAGTLKLGENGVFFSNAKELTAKTGATLDLQNGLIQNTTIKNLTLEGNILNVKIDADFAAEDTDAFNILASDGTGTIHINGLSRFEDMADGTTSFMKEFLYGTGANGISLTLEDTLGRIYSNNFVYDVNIDGQNLVFTNKGRIDGLSAAVADHENNGNRTYIMVEDENLTFWKAPTTNDMQGSKLVIEGNNHSILGNGNEGILINPSQSVTINNAGSIDENKIVIKSWTNFESENGGAFTNAQGTLTITNSVVNSNNASKYGGAIHNDQGTVTINNSYFTGNKALLNGGAVSNDKGTLTITDSAFTSNISNQKGGAIYNNEGVLNITAENNDVLFDGNSSSGISNAIHQNNGELNIKAADGKKVIFNDRITSETNSDTININAPDAPPVTLSDPPDSDSHPPNLAARVSTDAGIVVLNENMSGYTGDVNLHGGTIRLGENGTFFGANNFNVYAGTLDLANNIMNNVNLGTFNPVGTLTVLPDVDLQNEIMDTISAANIVSVPNKIEVNNFNLISGSTERHIEINFTDETLKDTVFYSGSGVSYDNIYKYNVTYDPSRGNFIFDRPEEKTYNDFNPSLFVSQVGAQLGGYLTALNTYDMVFDNVDMYMIAPQGQREAYKFRNKIAASDAQGFSPVDTRFDSRGVWFKPYSNFERVGLKNGPSVSNVSYGSLFGVDSRFIPLKYGFGAIGTVYAGYNGSHQSFKGNSIYQNGGQLGAMGVLYKGSFFSAWTVNAGANQAEASTMFGRDDFTMLIAGIASKTGYNKFLFRNKLIIQPNYMMSYTFVNTFDYRNAAGVKINSDPLNAIQIAPGIRIIGNLPNGWQPYIGVTMVWNLIDKARFQANDVSLPYLSIRPYVAYGAGLQKNIGETFTGFLQATIRNGGRNGIGLMSGFRWKI